jgi:hypothetical protein
VDGVLVLGEELGVGTLLEEDGHHHQVHGASGLVHDVQLQRVVLQARHTQHKTHTLTHTLTHALAHLALATLTRERAPCR